jgi:hypothetical protein
MRLNDLMYIISWKTTSKVVHDSDVYDAYDLDDTDDDSDESDGGDSYKDELSDESEDDFDHPDYVPTREICKDAAKLMGISVYL